MIFELIEKRRSVFPVQYNTKPIAKADIEKLLEAANWGVDRAGWCGVPSKNSPEKKAVGESAYMPYLPSGPSP